MKKIGFIDYYLDEWHANNYPAFLQKACGDEFKICYAYAEKDKEGGVSTADWCKKFNVEQCATIDEVVEKSDVLIVLSPDNPERHWDLCQKPFRSGKRVYVDKTFSLSKDIAQKLTDLAEANNTPFFSSSALRYATEMKTVKKENACFINSRGPGDFAIYGIHQIEPIVCIFGSKAQRIMQIGAGQHASMLIEFEGGRRAVMTHYGWQGGPDFNSTISYEDGSTVILPQMSATFDNFMLEMCDFFRTGEIKVPHAETVAIMGIIEAGHKAIARPGEWINI